MKKVILVCILFLSTVGGVSAQSITFVNNTSIQITFDLFGHNVGTSNCPGASRPGLAAMSSMVLYPGDSFSYSDLTAFNVGGAGSGFGTWSNGTALSGTNAVWDWAMTGYGCGSPGFGNDPCSFGYSYSEYYPCLNPPTGVTADWIQSGADVKIKFH